MDYTLEQLAAMQGVKPLSPSDLEGAIPDDVDVDAFLEGINGEGGLLIGPKARRPPPSPSKPTHHSKTGLTNYGSDGIL